MASGAALEAVRSTRFSPAAPPEPLLGPSDPALSPTPFDPLPPPLSPPGRSVQLADQPDNMLCLGIDAGVDRLKACVLDRQLNVVWTEKVEIDLELAEHGCARPPDWLGPAGDWLPDVLTLRPHPLQHAGRRPYRGRPGHLPFHRPPACARLAPHQALSRLPGPDPSQSYLLRLGLRSGTRACLVTCPWAPCATPVEKAKWADFALLCFAHSRMRCTTWPPHSRMCCAECLSRRT